VTGHLADNIAQFARVLRRAGMPVGPARVVDAVAAVEIAGVRRRDDLYWTLHAVFVSRHDQHPVFDGAFEMFWRSRGLVEKLIGLLSPVAAPARPDTAPKTAAQRLADALAANRPGGPAPTKTEVEIDARLAMSAREVLQRKDFAQMTAAELAEARRAVARLVLPLDRVATRRLVADRRGRRIDPRRTLREVIRTGGDLARLEFRRPAERPPPVVALVDISGSMGPYSRLFLHFLHALGERRRVHVFLFGTRLTNVTRALRMKDPDEALASCSRQVEDWAGGTRIGEALARFNRLWSRRVTSGGPVVLLVTDGLERDGVDGLARQTERLAKSCRRLVWLNPLLRYDGFEPKAQGVRAMLPHVDEFRAVHNLASIATLCRDLGTANARTRPVAP
jgi:uncharacterized protein with von Willebrand factor type A (vWA) domain